MYLERSISRWGRSASAERGTPPAPCHVTLCEYYRCDRCGCVHALAYMYVCMYVGMHAYFCACVNIQVNMSSLVCLCVYVPRNSHTNSTLYTLTPAPHRPLPRPAHHPRHQAAPPCSTRPARGRAQTAGTGRPCVCACTRPAEYTWT